MEAATAEVAVHAVQGVEENVFRGLGRSKPLFDLASVFLGLFVGRAIDIDQLQGDVARLLKWQEHLHFPANYKLYLV